MRLRRGVARLRRAPAVSQGVHEVGGFAAPLAVALREQLDGRAARYGSAVTAADGASPTASATRPGAAPRTRGAAERDRAPAMYLEVPCSNAPLVICSSPAGSRPRW